jgi:hypothetical protein
MEALHVVDASLGVPREAGRGAEADFFGELIV